MHGAFCIFCVFFATDRPNRGQFVTSPFVNWRRLKEKAADHGSLDYHGKAFKQAMRFLRQRQAPETSIASRLDNKRAENVARNRMILKCVVEAMEFCGKQNIALRGD